MGKEVKILGFILVSLEKMSKDPVNKSLFLELKQLKNLQTTFQQEAVFYLNIKKIIFSHMCMKG